MMLKLERASKSEGKDKMRGSHSTSLRAGFSTTQQTMTLSVAPVEMTGVFNDVEIGKSKQERRQRQNAGVPFDFAQGRLLHYATDDDTVCCSGRDDGSFQ